MDVSDLRFQLTHYVYHPFTYHFTMASPLAAACEVSRPVAPVARHGVAHWRGHQVRLRMGGGNPWSKAGMW